MKKITFNQAMLFGTIVVGATFATTAALLAKDKKQEIAIIISNKSNPYFTKLAAAAEQKVKSYNLKTTVYDSEDKTDKELDNVKNAINRGAKVIVLNVVNSENKSAAEYARKKGVKVIAVDRLIDNFKEDGAIFTDNEASAYALAQKVYNKVKSFTGTYSFVPNEVYQLRGKISSASNARNKGFGEGFGPKTIGNNNLWKPGQNKSTADWDVVKAKDLISPKLVSTGLELKIIFAENDNMAKGAIDAIKAKIKNIRTSKILNDKKIVVAGFDGENFAYDLIKQGHMFATVKQEPGRMGILGIEWAMKLLLKQYGNKTVLDKANEQNHIPLTGVVITKDNLPS